MKAIPHLVVALLVIAPSVMGADATAQTAAENRPAEFQPDPAALKRWQDMRFGMFIHWGPVSLTGKEIGWSRGAPTPVEIYDNLYKTFNPLKFNADEWVSIARAAGMKYIVLTTKHHDGFCLWPSAYTDYHIGKSPFKRDVVGELAQACRKQGIQFDTYYSICDWRHPDYPLGSPGGSTKKSAPDMQRHFECVKNQIRELLEKYGPLGVLWFDGEWETPWTREYGNALYTYLKKIQPSLLINNRVSKGRQGMSGVTEQAHLNAGDFDTPEQQVGTFNCGHPWESCITICKQWSWKPGEKMKSLAECLQALLRTVGGDGNLLFNVGPRPDGLIDPGQTNRLKEMGAWLAKYGESVYETRGGPYKPTKSVISTRKGNTVYLHITAWPEDTLTLPPLPAKIVKSRVLTGGTALVKQTETGVEIAVAAADRQAIDTIVALELDRPAIEIEPILVHGVDAVPIATR